MQFMIRNVAFGSILLLTLAACMGGGGNAVMDGQGAEQIGSPSDGIAHNE